MRTPISLKSPVHKGFTPGVTAVIVLVLSLLVGPAPTWAQSSSGDQLRPIGHEAYEIWNTIGTRSISDDGRWVLFTLTKEDGDDELVVRATEDETEYRIERGAAPTFALGDQRVVYRIRPYVEATREAQSNRNSEIPRDSLGILDLSTGERTTHPMIQGFQIAAGDDRYMAVHLRPDADEAPGEGEDTKEHGTLLLWDLQTDERTAHYYARSYQWAPEGTALLASLAPPETEGAPAIAGLHWIDAVSHEVTVVIETRGELSQLTFNSDATRAAFLHSSEAPESEEEAEDPEPGADSRTGADPGTGANHANSGSGNVSAETSTASRSKSDIARWALHHWAPGMTEPATVTTSAGEGLRDGWELSQYGSVNFSDDGTRLFFGTAPRPEPVPDDRPRLETEVNVEVWHYLDEELMTVQNVRANQERRRNYTAVHLLGEASDASRFPATGERIVQLADPDLPSVSVSSNGDGRWATGTATGPYGIMSSWESPNFRDSYLVEVETGERTLIAEATQANPSLSPEETFLTWYEPGDSIWYVQEVGSDTRRELSAGIPHPTWNEIHDSPSAAGSYGSAGWLDGESAILLYDRHDVWAVDPRNPAAARSLTGESGRANDLRYRLIQLDSDADGWDSSEPALANAFHMGTKDAGFARVSLGNTNAPQALLMEPRNFSNPMKASNADRLLFTQETFREFPDLWVSDLDFDGRSRMSEANPQQAEYRWGDAELMSWISLDGIELDGILITPDDFDPNRRYPMVVYFYDRSSDGLHSHQAPIPHRSVINRPMYASHDYVVFVPDIVYRIGYPGESAYNAIMPGVTKLIEAGFVDPERIALQGHSWGGYQIAFMVTRTRDLFRAAAAGAPVSNMTSAYGGIRWDSGLVRQFQYERTQSRLGYNLWDAPMRYIENSPLFWVDKIETPLLIMHNDRDGAVPWEQGIELFTAMRRLSKPAWMINYPGEPHWPTTFANKRDWNIRMKQFFDHFLKNAPPPAWMVEGIPAIRQGETLGYEPIEGATVTDPDGGR